MSKPRFPTIGDPETWGAFDPSSPLDRACDTERKLAIRHTVQRMKKAKCDQAALLIGMMMATTQLFSAATGVKMLSESDRAKMHELLDFALTAGVDAWDHGDLPQ